MDVLRRKVSGGRWIGAAVVLASLCGPLQAEPTSSASAPKPTLARPCDALCLLTSNGNLWNAASSPLAPAWRFEATRFLPGSTRLTPWSEANLKDPELVRAVNALAPGDTLRLRVLGDYGLSRHEAKRQAAARIRRLDELITAAGYKPGQVSFSPP